MKLGVLPPALHWANEGLAFLVELAALGAVAWWGARTGSSLIASVLMGVGAPLGAAVVWSAFAAPKARIRLPMAGVIAVKAVLFAAATAAILCRRPARARDWLRRGRAGQYGRCGRRQERRHARTESVSDGHLRTAAPAGNAMAPRAPSAIAAFVRSSPPMSVPFTKTCGNVGHPLQSLIASRSLHFPK